MCDGFKAAAASSTCRGFTVGRTIFHEPSHAWLAGQIDDKELIARVRRTFETLIDAWRTARAETGVHATTGAGSMNQRAMQTEARQATAGTIRLTTAQALVRYLAALRTVVTAEPLFGGVFAIFGHGNVAGIGEALYQHREELPTWRAHNEQAMAHSAIAYAKANFRRRMMAVTTSIGPGATNLVTAAALAHVNRLPVLLLPGDIFVSRAPDPVLQQVEDLQDGGISRQRCAQARIALLRSHRASRAIAERAAACDSRADRRGAVRSGHARVAARRAGDGLRLPRCFLRAARRVVSRARAGRTGNRAGGRRACASRMQPLIVSGGGVLYGDAADALRTFAERHGIPVAETQAGKSALAWDHPLNTGGIGVTGSSAANELANAADCVLAVGTRLQDFTTGSNTLFAQARLIGINANAFDALKQDGIAVESDARLALDALSAALGDWRAAPQWTTRAHHLADDWRTTVASVTGTRP